MDWGTYGNVEGDRYMEKVEPRSRRRCHCGCKSRASHRGMSNGVALSEGCEMFIRRWVKQGAEVYYRRVTDPRISDATNRMARLLGAEWVSKGHEPGCSLAHIERQYASCACFTPPPAEEELARFEQSIKRAQGVTP